MQTRRDAGIRGREVDIEEEQAILVGRFRRARDHNRQKILHLFINKLLHVLVLALLLLQNIAICFFLLLYS